MKKNQPKRFRASYQCVSFAGYVSLYACIDMFGACRALFSDREDARTWIVTRQGYTVQKVKA